MTNIIQSIQQISITIGAGSLSNTGTINSVTTNNTEIWFDGFTSAEVGSTFGKIWAHADLTNSTTVTVTKDPASGTGFSATIVYLTIVEYQGSALNSAIQRGTISLASVASNTATISSVTTANSVASYTGWGNTDGTSDNFTGREFTAVTLTNSTTVTGIRGLNPANTAKIGFQVVEFVGSVLNSSTQQIVTTFNSTATAPTVTITSVTTGNSIIRFGGFTDSGVLTNNATDIFYTIELTAATTVTFTRIGSNNSDTRKYYCTVVEFVSGVLNSTVQRGTIAMTSQTSNTATVTSVNTSYAAVNWGNFRMGISSVITGVSYSSIALTNATTLTVQMNTSNATANTTSYELIEFAPPTSTVTVDMWYVPPVFFSPPNSVVGY